MASYIIGILSLVLVSSLYAYAALSFHLSASVLIYLTEGLIAVWGITGIVLAIKLLRSVNRRFFKRTLSKNPLAQKIYPLADSVLCISVVFV